MAAAGDAAGVEVEQIIYFGRAAIWPQFCRKRLQPRSKNFEIATPMGKRTLAKNQKKSFLQNFFGFIKRNFFLDFVLLIYAGEERWSFFLALAT